MSSIRNAISTVRNFFTSFNISNQQEGSSDPGRQQQSVGFAGGSLAGLARKRPFQTFYELELTDDEDEIPHFQRTFNRPDAKRIKIEMASRQDPQSQRCTTRATGGPDIPGLNKQPWEFGFNSKREIQPQPGTSGNVNYGMAGAIEPSRKVGHTFGLQRGAVKTGASTSNENVEVITLDDEPLPSTYTAIQSSKPRKSSGFQMAVMKPRVSSPMKMNKTRDSNRLSKMWSKFMPKYSSVHRIAEKHKYQQLLKVYDIANNIDTFQTSALVKSKVSKPDLTVMYKRFASSPTKGTVMFGDLQSRLLAKKKESQSFQSPTSSTALVPVPKLFSTPTLGEDLLSEPKAIEYKHEPPIVDLDQEPSTSKQIEQWISPITPVSSRRVYSSSSPIKTPLVGNFTNLDDALNRSVLPIDPSGSNDEVLAIEDSPKPEDQDISILAEKIVDSCRRKRVNSLKLEQTSCPYTEKAWLENMKLDRRENQKSREQRIQEQQGTLDILQRESTLDRDLNERIRKKLTLTEIIVLEEPPEEFPEITEQMQQKIEQAKLRGNDAEVLAQVRLTKDTINITRGDVRTLRPSQWLNDNVINTYMGLIVLRSKQEQFPSVYAFQTFFYPKLLKEGYSNMLKRWTRKDDIFAHDLIMLPIHLGMHWCLACVDLRVKTIKYYDSLNGKNERCLNLLLDYLGREMKERKQVDLVRTEWKLENVRGIPQQQNGSDCGMFSCKFAEYLSRDANFTFTQDHMPYYRDRMIYELLTSNLLHP